MKYACSVLAFVWLAVAFAAPLEAAPNVFWTFGFDFPQSHKPASSVADRVALLSSEATMNGRGSDLEVPKQTPNILRVIGNRDNRLATRLLDNVR